MDRPVYAYGLGPDELRRRGEEWHAVEEAQVERHSEAGRYRARFERRPGVEERLRWLVEAERRCRPFLDIRLGQAGELIELEVVAPAGSEGMLPLL